MGIYTPESSRGSADLFAMGLIRGTYRCACKTEYLSEPETFECAVCCKRGCEECAEEEFVQCSNDGCKVIMCNDCAAYWNEDPICLDHAQPQIPARFLAGHEERNAA